MTGKKGFQVRAEAVRKLYLKSAPGAEDCVVEDPEQIRTWLNGILDRIIVPEYINIPSVEEGDVVAWNMGLCSTVPLTFISNEILGCYAQRNRIP
jgi:hypothetical protein